MAKHFLYICNISLGKTSLMYAAQYGYFEVVKILFENKAVVKAKDNDGKLKYPC